MRRHPALRLVLAAALAAALVPATLDAQLLRRRAAARADGARQTITVNGTARTFIVRAPKDLVRSTGLVPVVIAMHGGGGNAENAEMMTGFTALVERERLIAVYPDGSGRRGDKLLTWNAGHCCGYAMEQQVDEAAFVNALLDWLVARYPVDQRRVYVTGMSNGAMVSHRLGRELSHRVAAIAPVVGAVFGDEPAAKGPVNAIIFNGLLDTSVRPDGGLGDGLGRRAWDGTPPKPNLAQGEYWARQNGCDATPARSETATLIHWRWVCPAGRAVELYQVKDNGHAWPGGKAGSRRGDGPSQSLEATEVMWAFFKAHPKR